MALTDTTIRKAKSDARQYKLADEKGLFLLVHSNGSKYWRLKYRFDGKEKMLALGVYPDVGLKDARERRDEARKLLAGGVPRWKTERLRRPPGQRRQPTALRWFAVNGLRHGKPPWSQPST